MRAVLLPCAAAFGDDGEYRATQPQHADLHVQCFGVGFERLGQRHLPVHLRPVGGATPARSRT
jgi:hypothetical protein